MRNTLRVEDTSPVIMYGPPGAWTPGCSCDDADYARYSSGTYMLTSTQGATATIQFYGTHLRVYGAKRPGRGNYNVTLDGGVPVTFSANGKTPAFQIPLYDSGALNETHHMLVFTAASTGSYSTIDLDFVEIDADVGDKSIVLLDSDPGFNYLPSAQSWTQPDQAQTTLSEHTTSGHSTSEGGATTSLTFTGDSIDLYGLTGSASGMFTVSVDGERPELYNVTNRVAEVPQNVLFSARGLGAGAHTVVVSNFQSDATLNIGFAQVYGAYPSSAGNVIGAKAVNSTAAPPGVVGPAQMPPSSTASSTIAAVILGVLLFISILVVFVLLLRHKRSKPTGPMPLWDSPLTSPVFSHKRQSSWGSDATGSSSSSRDGGHRFRLPLFRHNAHTRTPSTAGFHWADAPAPSPFIDGTFGSPQPPHAQLTHEREPRSAFATQFSWVDHTPSSSRDASPMPKLRMPRSRSPEPRGMAMPGALASRLDLLASPPGTTMPSIAYVQHGHRATASI